MAKAMLSTKPRTLVEDVQVFSTGSGKQHKEHRYGSRLPKTVWALTSRSADPFPER